VGRGFQGEREGPAKRCQAAAKEDRAAFDAARAAVPGTDPARSGLHEGARHPAGVNRSGGRSRTPLVGRNATPAPQWYS
jgi:hypothetical protein